jgi:hypothetical protein
VVIRGRDFVRSDEFTSEWLHEKHAGTTDYCQPLQRCWKQADRAHNISNIRSSFQPLLWSSGQSSWLQIQRSQVRFSALPIFLRSSGSGTGSTQLREDN